MRRSRGRPDNSPASSPRESRAGDDGPVDRSGLPPVSREGRPAGRPETRASDDALVSFQRPRRASTDPVYASDSVDADESFDAHDVARGIRARTVRAARRAGPRPRLPRQVPGPWRCLIVGRARPAVARKSPANVPRPRKHLSPALARQHQAVAALPPILSRRPPRRPISKTPKAINTPAPANTPHAATGAARAARSTSARPRRHLPARLPSRPVNRANRVNRAEPNGGTRHAR